jgi:hypothetical protein
MTHLRIVSPGPTGQPLPHITPRIHTPHGALRAVAMLAAVPAALVVVGLAAVLIRREPVDVAHG